MKRSHYDTKPVTNCTSCLSVCSSSSSSAPAAPLAITASITASALVSRNASTNVPGSRTRLVAESAFALAVIGAAVERNAGPVAAIVAACVTGSVVGALTPTVGAPNTSGGAPSSSGTDADVVDVVDDGAGTGVMTLLADGDESKYMSTRAALRRRSSHDSPDSA
jgi:hypothetical protein